MYNMGIMEIKTETLSQLKDVLKDFGQPGDTIDSLKERMETSREKSERELAFPAELIDLLFARILKFPAQPGSEKTRWAIYFRYQNIDGSFQLKNIGLRLCLLPGQADKAGLKKTVEDIIGKTSAALLLLERESLIPLGIKQIRKGNFTLENQFTKFYEMYRYFRDQAKKINAKINKKSREAKNIASLFKETSHLSQQGFYYSLAMMDAYFSGLGHLFVIVLPFLGINLKSHDLGKILAMDWQEKFQQVFDIQANQQARSFYHQLTSLEEKFRNLYAPGGFEKKAASIYFHIPGLETAPVQLLKSEQKLALNFCQLAKVSFEDVCQLFDAFDDWLLTEKTRHGVTYARSGLSVSFDKKSRTKYQKAMESEEAFNKISRTAEE